MGRYKMDQDVSRAWSVAGLLMASAPVTVLPGVAAGQNAPPKTSNGQPPAAITNYWTPERMEKATPMDVGVSHGPKRPTQVPAATGPPGGGGGSLPGAR
jgi:hypothetical protein